MRINVFKTPEEMGRDSASFVAAKLRQVLKEKDEARLLVSTGASQFTLLSHLILEEVDWSRVTMFHLDEYVALPEAHKASFRKYLKERFVSRVPLKEAVFVNGEGDVEANIAWLSSRIGEAPIDIGLIGIGENGHIAFNDPPADFDTQESYIVVNLDERCKLQQVGEGWFDCKENVPDQAISMTVSQIMKCRCIVTAAPYAVKAVAIRDTLAMECTNTVPATILKQHPDWNLWIDGESASGFLSL